MLGLPHLLLIVSPSLKLPLGKPMPLKSGPHQSQPLPTLSVNMRTSSVLLVVLGAILLLAVPPLPKLPFFKHKFLLIPPMLRMLPLLGGIFIA